MTTLTSPEPGWRNRAPQGIAPTRTLRQRRPARPELAEMSEMHRSTSGV